MENRGDEIRIILVDDHALVRNGLRELISMRDGYRIVGEASDGDEFLKLLPSVSVDVVLMDIAMPRMGGAEATRAALELNPDLKIICLSMFGEESYYARMVEAGAKGFLLKDSAIDDVLGAIDTVVGGGSWFAASAVNAAAKNAGQTEESVTDDLSFREVEVLLGICRGLSTQEIADELFISKRTVDAHRAKILEKTGCKNTASLVVYAIRHRLVDL